MLLVAIWNGWLTNLPKKVKNVSEEKNIKMILMLQQIQLHFLPKNHYIFITMLSRAR